LRYFRAIPCITFRAGSYWIVVREQRAPQSDTSIRLLAPGVLPARTALDCWLLNAPHMRAVPGRKTDMTDAEWICDLVALGLVRPSFVPAPPIRRLRDLTRRRAILLTEGTREKQRMEKLLEDAGVKLSVVATDIFGKSGRAMLDALITGERDPKVLAELALGRLRKKIPALTEALIGRFDDHHAFLARMICDHIDTISVMVAELDTRIDAEIEPYRAEVELLDSLHGVDTAPPK
jgi:transposase